MPILTEYPLLIKPQVDYLLSDLIIPFAYLLDTEFMSSSILLFNFF